MTKGRLEAFSDGVIAIIITIMVLDLKVPHEPVFGALLPLVPAFLAYALSFVNVGIYWNNHHHLLQAVQHVDGPILWANSHLLFWLSLMPFATGWMAENHFAPTPVAVYGADLALCSVAYAILVLALTRGGRNRRVAQAIGADAKGKLSTCLYVAAIPLAFVSQWISLCLYLAVAFTWFVPDTRVERQLSRQPDDRD